MESEMKESKENSDTYSYLHMDNEIHNLVMKYRIESKGDSIDSIEFINSINDRIKKLTNENDEINTFKTATYFSVGVIDAIRSIKNKQNARINNVLVFFIGFLFASILSLII